MKVYQRLAYLPTGTAPPDTIDPCDAWWAQRGVKPAQLVKAKRPCEPGTYAIDCLMDARDKKAAEIPTVLDIEPTLQVRVKDGVVIDPKSTEGALIDVLAGTEPALVPHLKHALRNVAAVHAPGAGQFGQVVYERDPGWEPHRISWRNRNDLLREAGLFDACAALFPSCYAMSEKEVNGAPVMPSADKQHAIVVAHVLECNRVAPGKPVYVFFKTKLRSTGGTEYAIDCAPELFDATFRAVRDAGGQGVVLWSEVKSRELPGGQPDPLKGLTPLTGNEPWLPVVLEAARGN